MPEKTVLANLVNICCKIFGFQHLENGNDYDIYNFDTFRVGSFPNDTDFPQSGDPITRNEHLEVVGALLGIFALFNPFKSSTQVSPCPFVLE